MALRIAGAGYAGGDPRAVWAWPADLAFDVAALLQFDSQREETRYVLNERKG